MSATGGNHCAGVVGISRSSTFKNIVCNVNITYAAGKGGVHIGGVVATGFSTTVSHCTNLGKVDAGTSSDCVAGVAAYISDYSLIEYCLNADSVKTTATSGHIGGILGYINNTRFKGIQHSLNIGSVVAGSGAVVGAICGTAKAAGADSNNNYYLAGSATNVCGTNSSGKAFNATSLTAAKLKSGEACYTMNDKKSTGTLHWYQTLGNEGDQYPVLDATHGVVYYGYSDCTTIGYSNSELSETPAHVYNEDGVCTACGAHLIVSKNNRSNFGFTDASYDGYYAIRHAADLAWLAEAVKTQNATYKNSNAVLVADIDLSTISNWTPIGAEGAVYSGIFEGLKHSISGLTINASSSYQGLFGSVKNATLQNFTVSGEMNILRPAFRVGGIVGSAESTKLSNLTNNVDITVANDSSCTHIAGIAGAAAETGTVVSHCVNNGTINAANSSNCVGGIVGYSNSNVNIEYCLNAGDVSSTHTAPYLGGILGYINNGGFKGVNNCLNIGQITVDGNTYAGAICGYYRDAASATKSPSNYYMEGTADKGVGTIEKSKPITAIKATVDQLTSGEVCFGLNGSSSTNTQWYQKLGVAGDSYPVLFKASDGSNTVYRGYDNSCSYAYANTALSQTPVHDYSVLSAADANGLKHHLCSRCQTADATRALIENFSNGTNLELQVNGSTYTAGDVTITDGALASFGVNFTASSVTFERSFTANTGNYSFIVPFSINEEKAAELGAFYSFDSADSEKVYFDKANSVEANTAYFFAPAVNVTSIVLNESTEIHATSGVNAAEPSASGLYGTYQQVAVPSGAYGYKEVEGQATFVKAGNNIKVNPLRAYLWLNGIQSSSISAIFGRVTEEEEEGNTTAISNLEEANAAAPLYNLNGQRVANPRQGEIYLQNNKLIIKK